MGFEKFLDNDNMRAEFMRTGKKPIKSPSVRQVGKSVKVEF
jgi:hypothetical protein